MRKVGRILVVLAGLGIVLGTAFTARAQEEKLSRGRMQFQSAQGAMQIWAEDVALLQDRISGIPGEAFDSEYYSQGKTE